MLRTLYTESDIKDNTDIDNFIKAEMSCLGIAVLSAASSSKADKEGPDGALEGEWSEKSRRIAEYLTTLRRPLEMSRKEFLRFKTEAMKHTVVKGTLWRRATKVTPQKRVVDSLKERALVLKRLHEEEGAYKKREAIYRKVANRYY